LADNYSLLKAAEDLFGKFVIFEFLGFFISFLVLPIFLQSDENVLLQAWLFFLD
jgi:hypothetical protein